jgi:hypothetical protein
MASSLFNLISRAGSMSLRELAARSSADSSWLGQELAEMVRSGQVSLSTTSAKAAELGSLKGARDLPNEELAKVLASAFSDNSLAEAVTIVPTIQGYRSAIS